MAPEKTHTVRFTDEEYYEYIQALKNRMFYKTSANCLPPQVLLDMMNAEIKYAEEHSAAYAAGKEVFTIDKMNEFCGAYYPWHDRNSKMAIHCYNFDTSMWYENGLWDYLHEGSLDAMCDVLNPMLAKYNKELAAFLGATCAPGDERIIGPIALRPLSKEESGIFRLSKVFVTIVTRDTQTGKINPLPNEWIGTSGEYTFGPKSVVQDMFNWHSCIIGHDERYRNAMVRLHTGQALVDERTLKDAIQKLVAKYGVNGTQR